MTSFRGMGAMGGIDLAAAFLAGMALGAILAWRMGRSENIAWHGAAFPSRPNGAGAAGLTAASLRRVHSLLGEIRSLVASRGGSPRHGPQEPGP